jgi:hypothetical protein
MKLVAVSFSDDDGQAVTYVFKDKQKCIDKHNGVMLWGVPVITSQTVGTYYMDDEELRQFRNLDIVGRSASWFQDE